MQESVSNGDRQIDKHRIYEHRIDEHQIDEHQIDEQRAAVLIGVSPVELRSLARQAHLGEQSDQSMMFNYEELRQLCVLIASSHL